MSADSLVWFNRVHMFKQNNLTLMQNTVKTKQKKKLESWRRAQYVEHIAYHSHMARPQREREQDKEVEQHTNSSTLCNQGTSKPSLPIYLCVCL